MRNYAKYLSYNTVSVLCLRGGGLLVSSKPYEGPLGLWMALVQN